MMRETCARGVFFFFCIIFAFGISNAQSATYTVSCSGNDIGAAGTCTGTSCTSLPAAFAAATSAGDIVSIGSGSCSMNAGGMSWNAPPNAILMGAGSTVEGGGDQTVITDNYGTTEIGGCGVGIHIAATGTFRMTGLTIQGGSGQVKDNGIINFTGPGTLRIDHCHFNTTTYSSTPAAGMEKIPFIGNGVYGVMDHCILDLYGNSAPYIANGAGSDGEGNITWTQPTNFGGSNFFFIEDNQFNGYLENGVSATRLSDGWSGAREVVRFNNLHDCSGPEEHGTGHAGDDRGFRAIEFYGNYSTADSTALNASNGPNFDIIMIQTGGALVWGNQALNCYKNGIMFDVTRKDNATYWQAPTPGGWGYCGTDFDGTGSNWDQNSNTGTGGRCLDQPGSGPGDLITGGVSQSDGSSNTVGNFPNKVDEKTGTISWPNEALEPVYTWNNNWTVVPGWGGATLYGNGSCTASGCRVTQNSIPGQIDYSATLPASYYPQLSQTQTTQTSPTSPFNGTAGTGWGTLANRPTTCTQGVAYWATDQGDWNTSSSNPYGVQMNGQSGELYVCSATNTWTLYYTPYTYPNPLQNGAALGATSTSGTLVAPTGIRLEN